MPLSNEQFHEFCELFLYSGGRWLFVSGEDGCLFRLSFPAGVSHIGTRRGEVEFLARVPSCGRCFLVRNGVGR